MSATFAKGTKVPAESTRLEIEKLVGDRGAEAKLQRVIKAWKTLKKAGLA